MPNAMCDAMRDAPLRVPLGFLSTMFYDPAGLMPPLHEILRQQTAARQKGERI
jgi:hypothetical protein